MRALEKIRIYIALCTLLTCLSLLGITIIGQAGSSSWQIQTIDPNTIRGGGALAVDSNNNPHIVYIHIESRELSTLMYASWNGSKWRTIRIEDNVALCDLKLDSKNNPYILYANYEPGKKALLITNWNGNEWQSEVVTKEFSGGSALALDSNNNPHVIYKNGLQGATDVNTAALCYTVLDGPEPRIMTVDSPISSYGDIYLALDSNDNPRVLYDVENPRPDGSLGPQTLKYASLGASGWNIQTFFTDIEDYGNLVLDSHGYPHFTYIKTRLPHSNLGNVSIASWNGSNWNSQTVLSNTTSGGPIYLALDSHDYPSIDYMAPNPYANPYIPNPDEHYNYLMYTRWAGTEWVTQKVGPNSTAIEQGPIIIDLKGNPHILYAGGPSSLYLVTCMYATTTLQPTPTATPSATPTDSTAPAAASNIEPLLIAVPIAVVVAAVILVGLWRKK
jgi:hypothetical protein